MALVFLYLRSRGLYSEFPLGKSLHFAQFLGSFQGLLVSGQSLPHGSSFLVSKVEGLVLFSLVELSQILLLLLVHHNVHASDGLSCNTELSQLSLEVIQLLG